VAGQVRALTVDGGGWTVTAEVAVVPLRDAVTVAVPRARPVAVNEDERVWAGIRTRSPESPTMAGSLVLRATSVSVGWLAFKVRVRVPVLPSVRGRTGGARLATVGGGGMTVTWLWSEFPVSVAVIVLVPGPVPETANAWLSCQAGTETLFPRGRPRTPGSLVLRGTTVSLPWAALMVIVSVPFAPWVT
jgi:hypothetical protein